MSETFAPPRIATNGLSGLDIAFPRNFNSFSIKNPDTAGKYGTVEDEKIKIQDADYEISFGEIEGWK